jgi:hypothetical protein
MTTTTGPHRSRRDHLQGLLQREQFLGATEPAWERRSPVTARSPPATASSTTTWTNG